MDDSRLSWLRKPIELAVREVVGNIVTVVVSSLLVSASLFPFLSMVVLGDPLAIVVGLWTTCLVSHVVLVVVFQEAAAIADHELPAGPSELPAVLRREWKVGAGYGLVSFVVILVAVALATNPFDGLLGRSIAVSSVYMGVIWGTLLTVTFVFHAMERAPIRSSLKRGGLWILSHPPVTIWILVQTAGWTLVALVTIITPFVLLPGFLAVLITHIVRYTGVRAG